MKTLKLMSLTLLIMCMISCSKEENLLSSTSVSADESVKLLASIERTYCYGTCPVYSFKIFNNGFAEYEGINNIERIGLYTTHVAEERLRQLKEFANQINYFQMKDEYINPWVVDLPKAITFVQFDGKAKRVVNGYEGTPEDLIIFEKFIEGVLYETSIFDTVKH